MLQRDRLFLQGQNITVAAAVNKNGDADGCSLGKFPSAYRSSGTWLNYSLPHPSPRGV